MNITIDLSRGYWDSFNFIVYVIITLFVYKRKSPSHKSPELFIMQTMFFIISEWGKRWVKRVELINKQIKTNKSVYHERDFHSDRPFS